MPIQGALQQCLLFFKDQGKGQMPETTLENADMADINPHLPLRQDPVESNLVQQMLETYQTKMQNQIKSLEQ